MQFNVVRRTASAHERVAFYVELSIMHGDADSYDTLDVGPFHSSEEAELADLVGTLRRVMSDRPQGEDGYHHVEGFRAWFDEDYESTDDPHVIIRDGIDMSPYWWPLHPYAPYPGTLDAFKIVWYDWSGDKYDVEVLED